MEGASPFPRGTARVLYRKKEIHGELAGYTLNHGGPNCANNAAIIFTCEQKVHAVRYLWILEIILWSTTVVQGITDNTPWSAMNGFTKYA